MTASNIMVLNHALDVIISDDEDKVLLKDRNSGNLKLIGVREWSILKSYTEGCLELLFKSFKREYIEQVISKAIELKILVGPEAEIEKDSSPKTFSEKLKTKIHSSTNGYIKLDLQGNFSLYKVLTLHLKKGNFFESLRFREVSIIYSIIVAVLLFLDFYSPNTLSSTFFKVSNMTTIPITIFIALIFFSSYLFAAFHELGHFIVYKSMGGKSNIIGFGLKFLALPILYVNTDTVYLWKKRWKRILVSLGGSIMDITVAVIFTIIIKYGYQSYPNVAFFGYLLMISVAIKLFFNMNFLIPGTDGYFILTDLIGKNNYSKIVEADKNKLFYAIMKRDLGAIRHFKRNNWINIGYFLLSFIFKCLSIFLTLWSFLFIGKMLVGQ
jgi:Zn-dependent protease